MARLPVAARMVDPKRGPWTPEEDVMLVSYIQEHGPGNWTQVPSNAGLQRCGKSCRLRWKNYLRPGINRGNFTPEEDMMIIHYQALLGNRWAAIAAHLPSRTDNDVKNYWHNHLKKKLGRVNSSGDEMYKNATTGISMTYTPQNIEKKIAYDDVGIPALTSFEKWVLDDSSATFPPVLPTPAPALFPQVLPNPIQATASAHAHVPRVRPALVPAFPQVPPAPVERVLSTLVPVPLPEIPPAAVHQVLPALVPAHVSWVPPARVPQVLPAAFAHIPSASASAPSATPGFEGSDRLLNKFTPFCYDQFSFGPFD